MNELLSIAGFVAAARTPGGVKLIETLSNGIGTLYRPIGTILDAKADVVAKRITAIGDLELREALADRIRSREVRHETNIDAVAAKAYDSLPPVLDERPVDPDWTAQFLRIAGDVSNAELQSFWGRLLAGEIAAPGSVSKRTLSTLGVMGHADALAVQRLAALVWNIDDEDPIALAPEHKTWERWGLKSQPMFDLQALGLVAGVEHGSATVFGVSGKGDVTVMGYHGRTLRIRNSAPHQVLVGEMLQVTSVGWELCRVSGSLGDDAYLGHMIGHLRALDGIEVDIQN